tara:strand:- start:312 stop:674 length:363 start_codon:yes stop_codon:yes gene_type:complete
MKLTTHFNVEEFLSDDGTEEMSRPFIYKLEAARVIAGVPFLITSGYRTVEKAQALGNAGSPHCEGIAVDIACVSARDCRKIVDAAIKVGFQGIEVCDRHIHLDDRVRSHGEGVLWSEKSK